MTYRIFSLLVGMAVFFLALVAAATAAVPQIGAVWVGGVNASSVTFDGELNPDGLSTTYRFEYATDSAFQEKGFAGAARAPAGGEGKGGSGLGLTLVSQKVSALRPGTLYHYRLSAANASGTNEGPAHAFTTQEITGAFALPDSRSWELVSPPDKNGGAIEGPEQIHRGGIIQAAAGGEGEITYSSASSFGGYEGQSAPPASQYISARSASGWSTANISVPMLSGSYGNEPNGAPYQLFSTNLSRGVMLNGIHCRGEGSDCPVMNPPLAGSGAPNGYQDYYLRDDEDGAYTAVITPSNAQLGLEAKEFNLAFSGASPDLRHLVLSSCAALTAAATEVLGTEGCDLSKPNLYEYSEGQLKLINTSPGATLAAQAGAVSADGSRVYFSEAGKLYLREGTSAPQLLAEGGNFQGASADGSLAFYGTEEALGEFHLFRYKAASHSSESVATKVKGVLGTSEDGETVYYQDASGLVEWHEGNATTVAPGSEAALSSDYPPTTGTARVSPDGQRVLFLSAEELSGYDNHDVTTGKPDPEVFLWNAQGAALTCLSCNPTGERPTGPSRISGAYSNGSLSAARPGQIVTDSYKPRNLSATANRAFFESEDSLLALDTNKGSDVYQWEGQGTGNCNRPAGCLALISSGTDPEGASFLDASESGNDVYFLTFSSLDEARDPGSADVYDARVSGGFTPPPQEIECIGDACVPLPEPPEDPSVGTLVAGIADPPVHFPPKQCAKGTHRATRHGQTVCLRHHETHTRKHKRGHR